jgi:lipoprotein-anchoring transpeptidase ErfK/SrfK
VPAVVIAAVLGVAIGAVTSGAGAAERPPGQPDPLPSPQLTIAHQQHAKKHSSGDATTVAWDKPLAFSMADGVLTSVHVSGDRGPVPGKLGADGTSWKATGGLIPRLDYTATIDYRDLSGVMQEKKVPVHAADSGRRVNVVLSPGDGDTVGIGMPVSVTFGLKVPSDLRSDVLRDLSVTTDPHVDGAWHWMSSQEVHWRPEQFWSPGTTVSVSSDLSKVYFGDGFWGDGKHQTSFHIGDAHISVAHVQSHKMVITSNGQQVKTVPISTGRAKYPTMNGVHVVLSKKPKVIMDSETVGIPRHSPDGYYEHVYWDTRISNSGEFVHAAPWSVKDQGKRNVSHGCINVTTSEAKWFYHFSQRGDVVKVVGSTRGPLSWDAGTEDWNMPWDTWTSG